MLLRNGDVGNDHDQAGVQRFFCIEFEKVRTIIRDKNIFLRTNHLHEFPVFESAESPMIDVVTGMTC
jgi:hypothetical protein